MAEHHNPAELERSDTIENICTSVDDKDIDEWLARNERQSHMATQEEATRDWYTRALVRVKEMATKRSVDPYTVRTFRIGEELEMVQWGRVGDVVTRDLWWTSFDIDGALILEADKVEVVRILDEKTPFES